MHELLILEKAYHEIEDAYTYYEQQLPGLGNRFQIELNQRFNDLEQHPHHYGYINEDSQKLFRDVLLHSFPFRVVYRINDHQVVVCAVWHVKLNPKKLASRLQGY